MRTEKDIEEKTKTLDHYFLWKARKWGRRSDRRFREKLRCKICLNDFAANILHKHSELCMKKKQVLNALKTKQKEFSKFINDAENLVRTQKTIYKIERLH